MAATHGKRRTHPYRGDVTMSSRNACGTLISSGDFQGKEETHLRRSAGLGTRHTTSRSPHTLLQVIAERNDGFVLISQLHFVGTKKKLSQSPVANTDLAIFLCSEGKK